MSVETILVVVTTTDARSSSMIAASVRATASTSAFMNAFGPSFCAQPFMPESS